MSEKLEQITKKEFDTIFKKNIKLLEQTLTILLENIEVDIPELSKLTNQYLNLLKFRGEYRDDYKTHRIGHYLSDNHIIYKKFATRRMGFRQNYHNDK